MRSCRVIVSGMMLILFTILAIPTGIPAQDDTNSPSSYRFSKEELTQMLAPIALYPDALTAQILMAATYPLEIVEADRWREQNSQLQGSELDSALQDQAWDPSVKALCHFPGILSSMSDKLDQTRKLGDAFLEQEQEVMATVQELRHKAQQLGHLKSSTEQNVIDDQNYIRIEPSNPTVIYVPVYDPAYVYGNWWYPAYPPYYWYYPYGYSYGAWIGFAPQIYFGYNLFSWTWFDWPDHRIRIDLDRTNRFNRHFGRDNFISPTWRHNPEHRRGVAYRDLRTSERFGSRAPRGGVFNQERRGYPAQQRTIQTRPQQPVVRDTPFRGIGQGSFEQKAGERGGISNRSNDIRRVPPNTFRIAPGVRGSQIQRPQFNGSAGGAMKRPDIGAVRGDQQRFDGGARGGQRQDSGGTRR